MAVSERTRKILWGKAASRCALCQREVAADPEHVDDTEAVFGDECHIEARSPGGPRWAGRPGSDEYANLILLCRVDHKRIDDQPAYYTVERLHEMKAAHEARVMGAFKSGRPSRYWTIPKEPSEVRLTFSGSELLKHIASAEMYQFDHPDPSDAQEAELVGDLLQVLRDFGDIHDDVSVVDQVRESHRLTEVLESLLVRSLFVYIGSYVRTMHVDGEKTPFRVAVVIVKRVNLEETLAKAKAEAAKKGDSGEMSGAEPA